MNQEEQSKLVVTRFELLEERRTEYSAARRSEALRENGPKSVVDCM